MSLTGNSKVIDEYVQKIAGNSWKDNIVFLAEWYRHWKPVLVLFGVILVLKILD